MRKLLLVWVTWIIPTGLAAAENSPSTFERARGLLRAAYVAVPSSEAFEIEWQELGRPSENALAAFAAKNETPPERIASRTGKGFFSAYDRYRIEQCPIEFDPGPRELQCSLELLGDGFFLDSTRLKSELARIAPVAKIEDRTTVDVFRPNDVHCPLILSQQVLRWLDSRPDEEIRTTEEDGVLSVQTTAKDFRLDIRASDGQILKAEYRMLTGALLELRYEASLADGVYPAVQPLRSFISISGPGTAPLTQENRYLSIVRLRQADPRLFQWQTVAPNAFNVVSGKILSPNGQVDEIATRAFLERSQRLANVHPTSEPSITPREETGKHFSTEWLIGGAGIAAILTGLALKLFRRQGEAA